jgi:hypothetical protein
MTKFEVTDAMLESAIAAWFAVVEGIDPRTCEGVPVPPENLHDAMRAAITAALEASGLVERIAELETALMGLTDCLHVNVRMTGPTYSIVNGTRFQNAVTKALEALNKEPTQ